MKRKSVYIIEGILIFVGIVIAILSLAMGANDYPLYNIIQIASLIIAYIFIACYLIILYKVPHGNFLKWVYLVYALVIMIYPLGQIINKDVNMIEAIPLALVAIAIYLLSNSLNNIKLNMVLSPIIFVILAFDCIYLIINGGAQNYALIGKIEVLNLALGFVCLVLSYAFRYKEHKEAGNK